MNILVCLGMLCGSVFAIHPALFYEIHRSTPEPWEKEQINSDLSPFTSHDLSKEALDQAFSQQKGLLLVRVKVFQGNISIEKEPEAAFHTVPNDIIPHIYALNDLIPLPDIDFIFSAQDTLPQDLQWPIFAITKQKGARGVLFPDWYALKGFEPRRSEIIEGSSRYPWYSKNDLLFFRGGDSGVFDLSKWSEYPRARLVSMSLQYPELINARFALDLHNKSMLEMAKREGYIGDYVSMMDHAKYKYLMDIDGNCAATPRHPIFMFSNSVILKNTTNSILWFYRPLKPYIHFIPVAEDLSDLLIKLDWAKSHQEECQQIASNARAFANKHLTQEACYVYLYRLLLEYSLRQRNAYF